MKASELIELLRERIAKTGDLPVHVEHLPNGHGRYTEITDVEFVARDDDDWRDRGDIFQVTCWL